MKQISISVIGSTTIIKEVVNGKTNIYGSNTKRNYNIINGGIKILPNPVENSLNNYNILIDELTNEGIDFTGVTTPEELVIILAQNLAFNQGETIGTVTIETLSPAFKKILPFVDVSGTVIVDWKSYIRSQYNLIGDTELVFENFEDYIAAKQQDVFIKFNDTSHKLTLPDGCDAAKIKGSFINKEFTNHLSFKGLNLVDPLFEVSNYIEGEDLTLIPDSNFEQNLINRGYTSGPAKGYVPTKDISGIVSLSLSGVDVSDLTGIEDFAALEELELYSNPSLTEVYLKDNLNLKTLRFSSGTGITDLDLSGMPNIEEISISGSLVRTINVSNCPNINEISCPGSLVNTINASNSSLVTLYAPSANISNLDVSGCVNLNEISLPSNNLQTLDLSTNIALTNLTASDNSLKTLDISGAINLKELWISANSLLSLDISKNTNLEVLHCGTNEFSSIDISKNVKLIDLDVVSLNLTSIDISNNLLLQELRVSYNNISSLDVSNHTELTVLRCMENAITSLDLSNCPKLIDVYCSDNNLTSFNFKNGNNTNIDHFYALQNPNLTCMLVDDVAYSNSHWNNVDSATTFSDTTCN